MIFTIINSRKTLKLFVIVIILLFLFPITTLSQIDSVKFENISVQDGLSQSSIVVILQDSRGFMWFGTTDGLNLYDGYDFKLYGQGLLIRSLYEDKEGYIWIGTFEEGLFRFDPIREELINYHYKPNNPNSISDNDVRGILGDDKGNLWIATFGGGLNYFDRTSKTFKRFKHDPNNIDTIPHNSLRGLIEDENGIIWMPSHGGGLIRFNPITKEFKQYIHQEDNPQSISHDIAMCLVQDDNSKIWVGTYKGLNLFDKSRESFERFLKDPNNDRSLSFNLIQNLYKDSQGRIWVGTFGGGLNQFHKKTKSFTRYQYSPTDQYSLRDNYILSIYEDASKLIWVGTNWNGICKFLPKRKFTHYKSKPGIENSLSVDPVWSIHSDRYGLIYIGTSGGGLNILDREKERFYHYRHDPDDPKSLSYDDVREVYEDREGNIWVGTQNGGLNKFNKDTQTFTRYQHDPGDPKSLSHNDVREIYQDRQGNLWIGTFGGGLNLFDIDSETFIIYHEYKKDSLKNVNADNIRAIYEDSRGTLWIGSYGKGLYTLNRESNQCENHYQDMNGSPESINNDKISSIYEDDDGILWIGTYGGGLNRYDRDKESFEHYTSEHGLPNEVIYGVLGDNNGYIWMSHNKGISRFNPDTLEFKNFSVQDGLQSTEFNSGAYHKSSTGEMFFGGINGFNSFYPYEVVDSDFKPPVYITSIKKYDKEMNFRKSIYDVDEIHLDWNDDFFSFDFTALDYTNPDKNQYAYKLEGFNTDWIKTGNRRYASYTNLEGGKYKLKIKGSNSDGVWNDDPISIDITIENPPWQTWWAYSLYSFIFLVVGFSIAYGIKSKINVHKRELEKEREISDKLRQVDKLKDEFLANTSHELRTPLTGIIGIAESLLDGVEGKLSREVQENLSMIVSSGRRLATLVNDILDYSKIKEDDIILNVKSIDMKQICEIVMTLSRTMVKDKRIKLINAIPDGIYARVDENRIQQIMYNLIGNAIKFTKSGHIKVDAWYEDDYLHIKVEDTGIGISNKRIKDIFNVFEQIDSSIEREFGGTGLGLSITKKLIELHGGEIWVESTLGKGSVFHFTLPKGEDIQYDYKPTFDMNKINSIIEKKDQIEKSGLIYDEVPTNEDYQGNYRILIVDDEPVNLMVIKNYLLINHYYVITASTGEDALEYINENSDNLPDLVLLDIMMPKISGYEVLRKIREEYTNYELPIIMLTAKIRSEDIKVGLELGSNDYLTKPFDKTELITRINLHIQLTYTQRELSELNRELEEKVQERTSQLETAHAKVQQANEELLQTNEELEQSNEELSSSNNELEYTIQQLQETQQKMMVQEKMASLGSLMAGISHEIKNPLNFINNFSDVCMKLSVKLNQLVMSNSIYYKDNPHYTEMSVLVDRIVKIMEKIVKHGKRANDIVHSMLIYFHGGELKKKPSNINDIVKEYSNLSYNGMKSIDNAFYVKTSYELDKNASLVPVITSEIGRLILNLSNNAFYSVYKKKISHEGEAFIPEVTFKTIDSDNKIDIIIQDNGEGINKSVRKKVFEPFFTTKPPGEGTGLGLSISYDIVVNQHNGSIDFDTKENQGTVFKISLPK